VLGLVAGLDRVDVRLRLGEAIHQRVCDAGQVLAGIFLRQILRDLGGHIANPFYELFLELLID
jgi:hypothetical protein